MPDDFDTLVENALKNAQKMEGWDFSYLRGRRHEDQPPWSYRDTVYSMFNGIRNMLDMDTGGGEVLIDLKAHTKTWPPRVYATEAYPPNTAIAKRNLEPIGVDVVTYESRSRLPFDDDMFDLIINRHGSYSVREVKRILRPGGVFITQRIKFCDKLRLNALLGGPGPEYDRFDFTHAVSKFVDAEFDILHQEEFHGSDIFDDIGAIVFVLTAAPWELPGFSVEAYRDRLYALHQSIQSNGPLDVGIGFLLLVARK